MWSILVNVPCDLAKKKKPNKQKIKKNMYAAGVS